MRGVFKNFNTIEEFKSTESKKAMFDGVVYDIVSSMNTASPDLNPFLLVTFADLKKYVYQYWFAFPAFVSKPAWEVESAFEGVSEEVRYRCWAQLIIRWFKKRGSWAQRWIIPVMDFY